MYLGFWITGEVGDGIMFTEGLDRNALRWVREVIFSKAFQDFNILCGVAVLIRVLFVNSAALCSFLAFLVCRYVLILLHFGFG